MTSSETFPKMYDLFNWTHPVYTASFIVGFNFLYIIVFVMGQSLMSVMGWMSFSALAFCSPLTFMDYNTPTGLSPKSPSGNSSMSGSQTAGTPGNEEVISYKTIETITMQIYEKVNDYVAKLRYIFLWRDATSSLVVLISLAFVANLFTSLNLSMPMMFYTLVHGTFLYNYLFTFYKAQVMSVYNEAKMYASMIPKMDKPKMNS